MHIRLNHEFLTRKLPPPLQLKFLNLSLLLRGKKTRLRPATGELMVASHPDGEINFCRVSRYRRYKNGIERAIARLAAEYHLSFIEGEGGTFLDCGANVGELGFWARKKGYRYIAFEPESLEADCCDLNNYDGEPRTHRIALWKENVTLEFFGKPESADSSIFDSGGSDGVTRIPAKRLDSVLTETDLRKPVILKLEAEGAEPEVLEGCQGLIEHIDYVAVDCGPERGADKAHTFVEVNRFLVERGFMPVSAQFKRVTLLYKKVKP